MYPQTLFKLSSASVISSPNEISLIIFSPSFWHSFIFLSPVFDARKRQARYVNTKPKLSGRIQVVSLNCHCVYMYVCTYLCAYARTYFCACVCRKRKEAKEQRNTYACKERKRGGSFVLEWSSFGSLGQRICDLEYFDSWSMLERERASFPSRSPFPFYV